MKTIRIYQIKDISTCPYAFLSYKYAQDKLDLQHYTQVAEFTLQDFALQDDTDQFILGAIWELGNNGTLQQKYRMHSVSVSDIIQIDDTKYYVDDIGFKTIDIADSNYVAMLMDYYDYIQKEYKRTSKEFFKAKQAWSKINNSDISYQDYSNYVEYHTMRNALQQRQQTAIIRASLKKILKVLAGGK